MFYWKNYVMKEVHLSKTFAAAEMNVCMHFHDAIY